MLIHISEVREFQVEVPDDWGDETVAGHLDEILDPMGPSLDGMGVKVLKEDCARNWQQGAT